MSRLQEEMAARARRESPQTKAQQEALEKFATRCQQFTSLSKNKEFKEWLKLEEEMNDPKIVIAHDCTDSQCMALKRKIRDYWQRKRIFEAAVTNGTRPGP